jgi:low temperature requirement protein LtrA
MSAAESAEAGERVPAEPAEAGKRVSWVELYLDLVFVLGVGQLAHVIVSEPTHQSVWIALGLFVTLWWTWVGFAVQYNRHGADEPLHRLLFLAASVPAGVAAVAIGPASTGDSTVFALSLAVTRLVLAAVAAARGRTGGVLGERITKACLVSAALFALSALVPGPFRYMLWAIGIIVESSAMLQEDREASHRLRRDRDLTALVPDDPAEAVDAHHFAERFGLFLIIMLGEVVVEAGQGPHIDTFDGWAVLVAAMVIAAALWWLYFDSAADINLKVLELSGGSPTMARAIFAVGHMFPAFALLLTASGVGLLIEADPPEIAYWLACIGIGIYLATTRAFLIGTSRVPTVVKTLLLVATFMLGRLHGVLSPHAYLWLLTGWVVLCAALATRAPGRDDAEAVARYLGERRVRT